MEAGGRPRHSALRATKSDPRPKRGHNVVSRGANARGGAETLNAEEGNRTPPEMRKNKRNRAPMTAKGPPQANHGFAERFAFTPIPPTARQLLA